MAKRDLKHKHRLGNEFEVYDLKDANQTSKEIAKNKVAPLKLKKFARLSEKVFDE